MHFLPSPSETRRLTTDELRTAFLVTDLFRPGAVELRHIDLDRVVLGGAVPTTAPLKLEAPEAILSEYFCERRELGILNVGGAGEVTVDGRKYPMANRDVLYVGRGSRDIVLASADATRPARYYLVSYPAHVACPTTHMSRRDAQVTELGTVEQSNRRILCKYVHPAGIRSAQLVMGITELQPGSVWNSMPPHVHARRTEVYLYFDLPASDVVFHFLGQPRETRNLVVRDGEVALAPGWSIHAGCGTTNYTFCWAMGGENQEFADMQGAPVNTLR